jgi:hypothetical protein
MISAESWTSSPRCKRNKRGARPGAGKETGENAASGKKSCASPVKGSRARHGRSIVPDAAAGRSPCVAPGFQASARRNAAGPNENLFDRIERRGADVAIYDADGADPDRSKISARRVEVSLSNATGMNSLPDIGNVHCWQSIEPCQGTLGARQSGLEPDQAGSSFPSEI